MGTSWAEALSNGKKVDVKIKVIFDGKSKRPSRYDVEYWIDGAYNEEHFVNKID